MQRWISLLMLVLAGNAMALPPPMALPEPGVTLSGIHLLEPGKTLRRNVEVVVGEEGRIQSIEPAVTPADASPYAGMYVVPGLVDMHVHWPALLPGDEAELFAFLYLYHGVTTVRSMGDLKAGATEAVRTAIADGQYPGPTIYNCAFILDGPSPQWKSARVLATPTDAREAAEELAAQGVDCLKVYDGIQAPVLQALRQSADELGLPLVGHVPHDVPYDQALLDDMQHMRGLHPAAEGAMPPYPFFLELWRDSDEAHIEKVVQVALDNGLAVTPTFITLDRLLASADYPSLVEQTEYRYLPDYYSAALWSIDKGMNAARFMEPSDFAMVQYAVDQERAMVKALYEAGVPVHVGTDAGGGPGVVPGISVHQEMALLEQAGIPTAAVLQAATLGGREALGSDGPVFAPGAPADFLVLAGDPSADLSAALDIVAVVKDGRLYDRATLDAQLQRYIEANGSFMQRKLVTPVVRLGVNYMIERELEKRREQAELAQ